MLFNSWTFAVFFAVVLPLYYALDWRRQNIMLLLASYLFYGWWDWRFLIALDALDRGRLLRRQGDERDGHPGAAAGC